MEEHDAHYGHGDCHRAKHVNTETQDRIPDELVWVVMPNAGHPTQEGDDDAKAEGVQEQRTQSARPGHRSPVNGATSAWASCWA